MNVNGMETALHTLPAAEHAGGAPAAERAAGAAATGGHAGDHVVIDMGTPPGETSNVEAAAHETAHAAGATDTVAHPTGHPQGGDTVHLGGNAPSTSLIQAHGQLAADQITPAPPLHTPTPHGTPTDSEHGAETTPPRQVGWGEHLLRNVVGAAAGQATHQLYPPNLLNTAVNLFTKPKAYGQGVAAATCVSAASLLTEIPTNGASGARLAVTGTSGFLGVGANGANDIIRHDTIPKWMPEAMRPDMTNDTAEAVATGTKWTINAGSMLMGAAAINKRIT